MSIPCKLCQKKSARRYCPGIGADICPTCCGTERENTIDCPSECPYLQESRLRETPVPIPEDFPNKDIQLSEKFLEEHEDLILDLTQALASAMSAAKAVDEDAREALDAMIQTYRTRQSGLIYESRLSNIYAAAIQASLKQTVENLRKRKLEESGMNTMRDTDVLGTLVFLQRLHMQHQNGRRRGRAFFDFLRAYFPAGAAPGLVV